MPTLSYPVEYPKKIKDREISRQVFLIPSPSECHSAIDYSTLESEEGSQLAVIKIYFVVVILAAVSHLVQKKKIGRKKKRCSPWTCSS